ncbi:MAG TPA: DinB family protein [Chitinophagaceae bacterium]|nr:DinB family protein [Chitinophagaceae bacterium]
MKYLILFLFLSCSFMLGAQPAKRHYTDADNKKMLRLLDSTHNELLRVVNTLKESQFFYRIDTNTWSANDIVEHLGLIDEGYVRELWFSLAQPVFPASYADSTKGGDEKALAYATQPEKGKARGTNLPRNRYCSKDACVRIFSETNDLVKEFFTVNASKDLRRYFVFRMDGKGVRTIRDCHQLGLILVAHRIRHIEQLKRIIADTRFPG